MEIDAATDGKRCMTTEGDRDQRNVSRSYNDIEAFFCPASI